MASTYYFYDLETSGFNPKSARIMQFAGQRTDLKLKPIGQPDNILVKLTADVLPEADAVLVHGISPRLTQSQGLSEAAFADYLTAKVFTAGTTAVGFNNIRFDDEFIRYTFWRNFADPYEWHWKDGRSRWDLLDVTRMMRALRPEGIEWPVDSEGRASNRLGLLSSINKIQHDAVHDALSDVQAMIALAQLIKASQPKLFAYLAKMRHKKAAAGLVDGGQPFVYTSGFYPSEYQKTTAVFTVARPEDNLALVFDLREDPDQFCDLSPPELAKRWFDRDKNAAYFPVKRLSLNKAPAVAPLSVVDQAAAERLQLDPALVQTNLRKLKRFKDFPAQITAAWQQSRPPQQSVLAIDPLKADELLYEGFVDDKERPKIRAVRAAKAGQLAKTDFKFQDERLKALLPLYKARQYPEILSPAELKWWDEFRYQKLVASGAAEAHRRRLAQLLKQPASGGHKNLLMELKAYWQSVVPVQ